MNSLYLKTPANTTTLTLQFRNMTLHVVKLGFVKLNISHSQANNFMIANIIIAIITVNNADPNGNRNF